MLGHSGLLIFPVEVELIKHSHRPPATSSPPVLTSAGVTFLLPRQSDITDYQLSSRSHTSASIGFLSRIKRGCGYCSKYGPAPAPLSAYFSVSGQF